MVLPDPAIDGIKKTAQPKPCRRYGNGGIRTLAPVARPTAFRVRTLQPLGYISKRMQESRNICLPADFALLFYQTLF